MSGSPGDLFPVAVIGAGRVGMALATALRRLGADVAIGTRPGAGEARAAAVEGARVTTPVRAAREVATVLLTVQDAKLASLVEELAVEGAFSAGQLVVHVAGVDGPAPLEPAALAGAAIAACHPVQTFTDDLEATLRRLNGSFWSVTAGPGAEERATLLVRTLGGRPVEIGDEARPLYHAALVLAANGAGALAAVAGALLRSTGVTDPAALLVDLVGQSVASALATGHAGLSGPWVRGDGRTVTRHLAALEGLEVVQQVYADLARLVADLAAAGDLSTTEGGS